MLQKMLLHKHSDILTAIMLMSMFCASSQSLKPLINSTNTSDKESLTSNTTPVHRPQSNATTTDSTISPSSAPTELFDLTTIKTTNIFPTTTATTNGELLQATETTEGTKSRTTTSIVEANAQANKAHESSSSTILAVSLSIKKMKKGFQEEMAVICLHDELASEALYCSWKPFMDGNENNKIKLVIETSTSDANTSRANT
ncbi:hypothetical protein pdam_00015845 [Pocillopora damicornis]|uniref:Uncharacterized protein n=1 Tax=Pocillopora damicornis TaxID=46731 RepID=A0A3M6TK82_POCDA|nr:hypothetical protein pdam_00015845 [Pocillopora damicornis]